MSFEQVCGVLVDWCMDNWVFGCVFFEMLIGKKVFFGKMLFDMLVVVLCEELFWSLFLEDMFIVV